MNNSKLTSEDLRKTAELIVSIKKRRQQEQEQEQIYEVNSDDKDTMWITIKSILIVAAILAIALLILIGSFILIPIALVIAIGYVLFLGVKTSIK